MATSDKHMFEQFKRAAEEQEETGAFPIRDSVWEKLDDRLQRRSKRALLLHNTGIAAGLILLVGLSSLFFTRNKQPLTSPDNTAARNRHLPSETYDTAIAGNEQYESQSQVTDDVAVVTMHRSSLKDGKQNLPGRLAAEVSRSSAVTDVALLKEIINYTDSPYPAVAVEENIISPDAKANTGTAVYTDQVEKTPLTDIAKAIGESAPGIQVTNSGGQPGSGTGIKVRGRSSIHAGQAPLYVVDGVPYNGDITNINPEDIQEIITLKDASAQSLYGSRSANGVVIIKTKRAGAAEAFEAPSLQSKKKWRLNRQFIQYFRDRKKNR